MELYKICSKKLFLFSASSALVILLLYMNIFVINADSTIDGVRYTGYQAVRMDRRITAEFEGVLTDQKVEQIVEKYGFPYGVSENYNRFLHKNYLNDFVMNAFSDGYFHTTEDYRVGTCTYPIAETELGKAGIATKRPLVLEYSYGWQVFVNVLQVGCVLGMVLILLGISPVFSEESALNTQQILFATKEGRAKDIGAKIAAGMTIVFAVYALIIVLDFAFVWAVFGLNGLDCFYAQVIEELTQIRAWNNYHYSSTDRMGTVISYLVVSEFLGITGTGALTLYFSAHCKSPFQSVMAAAISITAPLFLMLLGRTGNFNNILFLSSQIFNMFILGIAFLCLAPDFSNKTFSFDAKLLFFAVPPGAGLLFWRKFPFFRANPVYLIMRSSYDDMDIFRVYAPWIYGGILLFTAVISVLLIVCSWKKYRD